MATRLSNHTLCLSHFLSVTSFFGHQPPDVTHFYSFSERYHATRTHFYSVYSLTSMSKQNVCLNIHISGMKKANIYIKTQRPGQDEASDFRNRWERESFKAQYLTQLPTHTPGTDRQGGLEPGVNTRSNNRWLGDRKGKHLATPSLPPPLNTGRRQFTRNYLHSPHPPTLPPTHCHGELHSKNT